MRNPLRRGRALFAALVTVLWIASHATVLRADYILNPETYRSPSGHYELFVDPSAADGSGPGLYRMTKDGEELWFKELPFSLWNASVADSGRVAGYAYEGGVSPPGHHGIGYSKLAVCILAPDGTILQRDSSRAETGEYRVNSWAMGNSPAVSGTLLDEHGDRFTVRVPRIQGTGRSAWWSYRMSTGEYLGTHTPEVPMAEAADSEHRALQVIARLESVPETPFLVAHWFLNDYSGGPQGRSAALSVLGHDGKQLWKLELPEEYDHQEEFWLWNQSAEVFAQLRVEPHGFSFKTIHEGLLLSFDIVSDDEADSGWRVVESGRTERSNDSEASEPSEVQPPALERVELEELEPIRLKQPSGAGYPIAEISDFSIDDEGCFGFVGSSSLDDARFIRVAPNGDVLAEVPLDEPPLAKKGDRFIAPTATGRWIVIQNEVGEYPNAHAWWLDPSSSELVEIKSFSSPAIVSIAPTGDGGFLTLSSNRGSQSFAATVECFDAEGDSTWMRDSYTSGEGRDFDALTFLPGVGAVALSGGVRASLTTFGLDGHSSETVELSTLLNRKLNYPSGLRAGPDGGLLLYDFGGEPCSIGLDAELRATTAWSPRLADGRLVPIVGDVQAAPDGSLWTSDGQAFLRLDEEGVVDLQVRPLSTGGAGGYEATWTIDHLGQIYTFNTLTAEVRVYAPDGSFLHACKTESTDYEIRIEIDGISVDGAGRTFVQLNAFSDFGSDFLVFSATGERMDSKKLSVDSVSEDWLRKPGSEGSWVLGYNEIFLLDENEQVEKTLLRRANRDWLQAVVSGAVAADGSLAVIAGPLGVMEERPAVVSIYDAEGEPLQAVALQQESSWAELAFDGQRLIVADDDIGLCVYDLDGTPPKLFLPDGSEGLDKYWYKPYISPDGTELWLDKGEPGVISRYKLN